VIALTYIVSTAVFAIAMLIRGLTPLRDLDQLNSAGLLLMYIVYLLFLPWILRQFHRGVGGFLLCGSFGLWLLAQWKIGPQFSLGYLLAWQFLFVGGVWIGYARNHNLPIPTQSSKVSAVVVSAFCLAFFFLRHPFIHHPILSLNWEITNKEQLGFVRLLNVLVVASLIGRIPREIDEKMVNSEFVSCN
jgi:hypothetical protein